MKPGDFSGELKHRRVYRAVALYVVVMFGLWQAADIAIPALSLPEALMRYIVVGALLGLPLVAILSWIYDVRISRSGPRSPSTSSRTGRTAALAVVATVGVVLVGGVVYRTLDARTRGSRPVADPRVSFELGVERYFAGDAPAAAAMLEAVAEDETTSAGMRQEALRYLVRNYSEANDTIRARAAMRRLVGQEPPLALMLPAVETERVMELYYDARREKLAKASTPPVPSAVTTVEVLDFVVLGDPPEGVSREAWQDLGAGVGEMLAADLNRQFDGQVTLVDRSVVVGRSYDVYRYLDSPEASRIRKPSHLLIGSVTWRRNQLLVSAWLMDAEHGTLARSRQVVGTYEKLFDLLTGLSKDLAQAVNRDQAP